MELYFYIIIALGILVAVGMAGEKLRTVVDVPLYLQGVVSVKGAAPTLIGSGRHTYWTKDVQYQLIDTRETWLQVSGQELLTKDGAPIRVSVSVMRSVADPLKFAAADAYSMLYVATQLAVREQVLSRSLEELIDGREAVSEAILQLLEADAQEVGVKIERVAVRDLTLIGDTKRAYAEVIQAQLQAKAKLERARGEAAAVRSLLNTAELVRKNPELLQLRALQQLESGQHEVQFQIGLPGSVLKESG